MANFTKSDLHIPNKEWADNALERENYSAIERWARGVSGGCNCYVLIRNSATASVPTSGAGYTTFSGYTTLYSVGSRNGMAILVTARVLWPGNNTGTREIGIGAGTTFNDQPGDIRTGATGFNNNQIQSVTEILPGNVSTYSVNAWQSSGGALNASAFTIEVGLCCAL